MDVRRAVRVFAALGVVVLTAGCGGGGEPRGDEAPAGTIHPRFDPAPDPMDFGAIPWPDDLYLSGGSVAVGALPGQDAAERYHDALRRTLAELDGFGTVSSIFFTFDGEIAASSLPDSPASSTREDASVFLLDVDSASPEVLDRIPIAVDWDAPTRTLALRPNDGHPLREGRRYAAVLTTRVRGSDGLGLAPDPDFATVRDAEAPPDDPLLAEAFELYDPVLATLANDGIPREDVAALAVFHVQTVSRELRAVRAMIRSRPAPAITVLEAIPAGARLDAALGTPEIDAWGLDVPGGVKHGNIGWMIHGTFGSPWLLSGDAQVHGRFTHDLSGGNPFVHFTDTVPFTLWLPRVMDPAALRVVIYQHGLSGDRSAALSVADALAGAGYAVLAIDAPFHGMRAAGTAVDDRNRFTGAMTPDRFGDVGGSGVVLAFAGILDVVGELEAFHPVYLRDALRQSVVDLLSAAHVVAGADLGPIHEVDPELAGLAFEDRIGFVGYSLGGIIGTMFVATEDEVGAAVLGVTGGHVTLLVSNSPEFNAGYFPTLLPILGIDPEGIDYEDRHPTFYPQIAIWQTLLDRGDAISYAPLLREQGKDVLFLMARDDEVVNNVGTESLARAAGAQILGGEAHYADLAVASAPVRGNLETGGTPATRVLQVWAPASHGLLAVRSDVSRWAHPVEPPFTAVPETPVAQPIDAAMTQLIHFFESWRSGGAEVAAPAPR